MRLIFSISVENFNVGFVHRWVPRELNACADEISNIIDFNEWYTTQGFFLPMEILSGAPILSIGFANASNAQLPRFSPRFRVPGQKLLMLFQSHEQQRITGSFRQLIVLLYLLDSTRAAIGQFSGPYCTVRPAKSRTSLLTLYFKI